MDAQVVRIPRRERHEFEDWAVAEPRRRPGQRGLELALPDELVFRDRLAWGQQPVPPEQPRDPDPDVLLPAVDAPDRPKDVGR
jgi:hypothetical protein